jgi:hypothetical protein
MKMMRGGEGLGVCILDGRGKVGSWLWLINENEIINTVLGRKRSRVLTNSSGSLQYP